MPSKQNNVTQTSKHAHMNIDIYKLFKKQLNKTHKLYVHNKKNQINKDLFLNTNKKPTSLAKLLNCTWHVKKHFMLDSC